MAITFLLASCASPNTNPPPTPTAAAPVPPPLNAPLWPEARFTFADLRGATHRGLAFIRATAATDATFAEYGSDFLWCYAVIAQCSADPTLRAQARGYGLEAAQRWKKQYPRLPLGLDPDTMIDIAMALESAEMLGVHHPLLREQLEQEITQLSASDVLYFDPAKGPPPLIPDEKPVAAEVPSRADPKTKDVVERPDWETWYDAMISAYFGERFGVTFGAPLARVLRWKPQLLPYRSIEALGADDYYDQVYMVTHLVYVTNTYGCRTLDPLEMPDELYFLWTELDQVLLDDDGETYAEFIDTLKSFGFTPKDSPRMARAIESLLAEQNPDGSWGDPKDKDAYNRYHTTWTAVDALREYRYESAPIAD